MTLAAASRDAGHVRAATMPGQCDGVEDINAVPSQGQYNQRTMATYDSQDCLTELITCNQCTNSIDFLHPILHLPSGKFRAENI